MRVLTLHAPWASLCVTRQPCDCVVGRKAPDLAREVPDQHALDCAFRNRFVKRFETRSRPCPPHLIGRRIAIHQAARTPHVQRIGDYMIGLNNGPGWSEMVHVPPGDRIRLPLGVIVGTAVIARSLPIVHVAHVMAGFDTWPNVQRNGDYLTVVGAEVEESEDISAQFPYGDWTPGRHAYELVDVEVLPEPVKFTGGQGWSRSIDENELPL